MELTQQQFDVLVEIEQDQENKHTQRQLSKKLKLSLGVVNKIINLLVSEKLIIAKPSSHFVVTKKGYEILEPYRVQRAIFIAAGFGERLMPITLNTPKPLIRVKGKRMIDTLLDACKKAEIEEIYIVRGYLKEQFDSLLSKYPNIQFVDNPLYNEASNIASAYFVKEHLQNAYVLEGDLLLYNTNLIRKYEYQSNYLAKKVEMTDDWCFEVKSGIIQSIKIGGKECYHMYGISYWTNKDGMQLAKDIDEIFHQPGGKEKFWDVIPTRDFKDHYKISIREVENDDIIEIDTFNELKAIDPAYRV